MSTPRGFVGGVVRSFLGLCLSLLLASAAWGQAASPEYQILLDTDHNPATGCTVPTANGDFAGVDQRLVTTVAIGTNAATVGGVQLQTCVSGAFGAVVWSDPGGWPVGLGTGTGGAAVIETYLPLAQVNGPGPLRLGVVAQAGQARDALLLADNGQGGGGIQLPLPVGLANPDATAIPVLNPLMLALLVALLGGALRYGRRYPGAARLMVLVVAVAGAGLAWAAFVRDGQTTDWASISPLATDPQGDADSPVDLIALFGKAEGANLNFRIDARITLTVPPTNQAPQVNAGADQTITLPATANLAGTVTDDGLPNPPGAVTVTWSQISGPGTVTFGNANAAGTTATFDKDGVYVLSLTASDSALPGTDEVTITVNPAGPTLPPDPATVAPPIDPTVATTHYAATSFLYTGANPIQTGVAPGTINPVRSAVLRGKVLDKQNNPLPGVTMTILNHPEFGQTLSRADGMFDLAVNGGGILTLNYTKDGYLPVQRQANVPWQDYVVLDDVVMIPLDPQVTTIDLSAATPIQVARGSVITDSDGTRQATLFFSQGTTATVNGVPLTTLNVRATEYTVGENGPQTMPGPLPANVGYTYAVELSADEAPNQEVRFSQPVINYVENFLNFPVGGIVPVGYYDRVKAAWIPSDNGRVIKILSLTGGLADLDTNGDGAVDDAATLSALGVTDAERQQLAALYSAGQSLWRVRITHFTPEDYNWPYGPPLGAKPPQLSPPAPPPPLDCNHLLEKRSIIQCESQILGESLPLTGSPARLHYGSERVPGNKTLYTLEIPLSGATLPASLRRIRLEIFVAGRKFEQSFPAMPNQRTFFTWDGKDAHGRTWQGAIPVGVRIGYEYRMVYQTPENWAKSWANVSGIPMSIDGRMDITLWQESLSRLGALTSGEVGHWTFDVHHTYDPILKILYLGDGARRSGQSPQYQNVITTLARDLLTGDAGLAVAPDGGVLYTANGQTRRVDPITGVITTFAGTGASTDVAIAPDGGVLIADGNRIRRVSPGPNGIITTIAGTGTQGSGGDGGPATQAQLNAPKSIAAAPDGSVYIAESGDSNRVRRIDPDGMITTFAGGNAFGPLSGEGVPVSQATFRRNIDSVAVGPDGSVYISNHGCLRRVKPDGIITTFYGGNLAYCDSNPAAVGQYNMAFAPDGSVLMAETSSIGLHRILRRSPDGGITTIAGTNACGYSGDGGPAAQALLCLPKDIALAPDGSLYIYDSANSRIRKIAPPTPGFNGSDLAIASEDGRQLYRFTAEGRHLSTVDTLTNTVLYTFGYDSAGRLSTCRRQQQRLTVERDGSGNPTALVAPFGQRTTLSVDGHGYLNRVTNPAGEAYQMQYTADGLLTRFTDPRNHTATMTYDTLGRLISDTDPAGGSQTLARAKLPSGNGYTVTRTTGENRTTSYRIENLGTGDQERRSPARTARPHHADPDQRRDHNHRPGRHGDHGGGRPRPALRDAGADHEEPQDHQRRPNRHPDHSGQRRAERSQEPAEPDHAHHHRHGQRPRFQQRLHRRHPPHRPHQRRRAAELPNPGRHRPGHRSRRHRPRPGVFQLRCARPADHRPARRRRGGTGRDAGLRRRRRSRQRHRQPRPGRHPGPRQRRAGPQPNSARPQPDRLRLRRQGQPDRADPAGPDRARLRLHPGRSDRRLPTAHGSQRRSHRLRLQPRPATDPGHPARRRADHRCLRPRRAARHPDHPRRDLRLRLQRRQPTHRRHRPRQPGPGLQLQPGAADGCDLERRAVRPSRLRLRQRLPAPQVTVNGANPIAYTYDADSLLTKAAPHPHPQRPKRPADRDSAGRRQRQPELQQLRRDHRLHRHRWRHVPVRRAVHA